MTASKQSKARTAQATRSTRPARPQIHTNLDGIPATMRATPRWFCWTYIWKEDKWDKVPIRFLFAGQMHDFERIDYTNPANHLAFDVAASYVRRAQQSGELWIGMGFYFTEGDKINCCDLDDCRDPVTGELTPYAKEVISEQGTYTEASVSGTGAHVIGTGEKPGDRCRQKGIPIEMYDRRRFVAITGNVLPNSPADLAPNQSAITARYYITFPDDTPDRIAAREAQRAVRAAENSRIESDPSILSHLSLSDSDLIDRAIHAKNGERFRRFWNGDAADFGGDQSAADFALANALAFWTRNNAERIISLMRQSPATRDKWDTMRGRVDWLTYTVEKLIAKGGSTTCFGDGGGGNSGSDHEKEYSHLPAHVRDELVERLTGGARQRLAQRRTAQVEAVASIIAAVATPIAPDDTQANEEMAVATAAKAIASSAQKAARACKDPSMCPNSFRQVQWDKEKELFILVDLRCKCWECPCCIKPNQAKWTAHLVKMLLESSASVFYVDEQSSEKEVQRAFRDRVKYLFGQWLTVRTPDPSIDLALSTVRWSDSCREVSKIEAIRLISQTVQTIPLDHGLGNPIHCCEGWRLKGGQSPNRRIVIKTFDRDLSWMDLLNAMRRAFSSVDIYFPNGASVQRAAASKLSDLALWEENSITLRQIASNLETMARGGDPDAYTYFKQNAQENEIQYEHQSHEDDFSLISP